MRSLKQKNLHDQWFEEQIVQGKNLVNNPVLMKVQQNLSKKQNTEMKEIPRFSSKKLKEIQHQISNLKSVEPSKTQISECTQSIICLMCWVWQSESQQYIIQKSKKRTKKLSQNQEEIDCSKCIRKLLQFFNKNHQIFSQPILFGRDIIQKNGIKTKIIKNSQKTSKSSKKINQKESHQIQNGQEVITIKNYVIYEVYRNLQKFLQNNGQVSLMILLLEIIVLSYQWIVLLDINVASSAITRFASNIMKNNGQNDSFIMHQILQQLTIFTFSELYYLKIGQANNPQNINSINRKRGSELILWKFFANLIKIIHSHMNQSNFRNFNFQNLQFLKIAHILVSELTHYMKKNGAQIKQIKIKDLQHFFENFIQRIIEAQYFLFELKQMKTPELNDFKEIEIFNYKFELFLFDWALLVIKNDENKLFKKVMKICKKKLFKSIEEKDNNQSNSSNNYRVNEPYNNFIIKQDPNQFSQGKSKSQQKQILNRQSEQQVHENLKIDPQKIKMFLSVPHMKLLNFKQNIPFSFKRRQDKKLQSKKQGHDDCIIYFLILYNRQYIMQLLQEMEFIEAEQLDPDIGKGLIKLCTYCNKFTSLILSERYFKILSSKPNHHKLLQSVFEKDIDYQRRLSQSRHSYHSNNKTVISSEIQSSNQNDSRIFQKSQTIQQEDVLKVRLTSCEAIFFEMITQIQSKITLLKLSTYIDEAMKKPQIFRAQVFYHKLLQYQHPGYGKEYLSQLIIKWIDHELRFFNILTYFDIFFKNCLFSQEKQGQLKLLIEELPISKLIKLHCLLLTQTFVEQNTLKVSIPQGVSPYQKMQLLTSGGFEQKVRFIDKQFNGIADIIQWNKYLKLLSTPFQRQQKYIYIKSYFTLIFYSFSEKQNWNKNEQKLISLIEKLKIDIQKDRVDEVCSIFHFLSLALFPNKSILNFNNVDQERNKDDSQGLSMKMRSQNNSRQKITQQILYVIRQNYRKMIDMFKNKESLTIKYLTDDIRRKTANELNSDVQEMKRKQVAKMLNKQKLMHDYLIKIVVRFLQNIDYTQSLLRNFHSPQQFSDIVTQICKREYLGHENKLYSTEKALYTPKLNFFMSSVSSVNNFQMNFKKQLKRFDENFDKHYNRYPFLLMVRFIAQKWIQQKSVLLRVSLTQKIKSKNTKTSKSSVIDNRSKLKNFSITNLIPIQSIFEICFSVLQINIVNSMTVRQSEILKQKIICLETVCLLSNFLIQNSLSLQTSSPSLLKIYRTNFHAKFSQMLISFLMNNEKILGKNERQLILHLRLQVLSHIIQNYSYNSQQNKYQWRLIKDRKSFWFLIDCLIFDKAVELRFYIVKNALCKFSTSREFRVTKCQKIKIFLLMVVQEPLKPLIQLAKKCLTQTLQFSLNSNSTKGMDLMLNSLIGCIQFIVNFNMISILQKNEKKFNEKQFFQILIDILFDKRQMQTYFFALVQSFKALINCKSGNQLIKIIQPLDWDQTINIQFYLTSKSRVNKYSFTDKSKEQNKKMYLQLLEEFKEQTDSQSLFNKSYNKQKNSKKKSKIDCKKIQQYQSKFFQLLLQTLKSIEEVFKLKYARLNKKYVKTKRPISQIFDTPIVPNISSFLNQTFQKQEKTHSGRNIRQSEQEIEI